MLDIHLAYGLFFFLTRNLVWRRRRRRRCSSIICSGAGSRARSSRILSCTNVGGRSKNVFLDTSARGRTVSKSGLRGRTLSNTNAGALSNIDAGGLSDTGVGRKSSNIILDINAGGRPNMSSSSWNSISIPFVRFRFDICSWRRHDGQKWNALQCQLDKTKNKQNTKDIYTSCMVSYIELLGFQLLQLQLPMSLPWWAMLKTCCATRG